MDMTDSHNTLCTLALALLPKLGLVQAKALLERVGGQATLLVEHSHDLKAVIPDIHERAMAAFLDLPQAMDHAQHEMDYVARKGIRVLTLADDAYPSRLRDCPDAPLVLFYLGSADLNRQKVISMVGTRRCTPYGRDICTHFLADLRQYCPDVLVVSGLAYGIDICSHRAALDNQMDTVGVLAHGLDRIYPAVHRDTAARMTRQGGLLTEYPSGTTPEKINFVRRNRIVAGMADATIVVESANRGGSLITADIALSYHRDVLAFPGRIYDPYSEGCNRIIKEQKAVAIRNADDLLNALCWENPLTNRYAAPDDGQLDLFRELEPDEQLVIDSLRGHDERPINQIVLDTGLDYGQASSLLFDLEVRGLVTALGGARYHLNHK